jgi:hypothetical protein
LNTYLLAGTNKRKSKWLEAYGQRAFGTTNPWCALRQARKLHQAPHGVALVHGTDVEVAHKQARLAASQDKQRKA